MYYSSDPQYQNLFLEAFLTMILKCRVILQLLQLFCIDYRHDHGFGELYIIKPITKTITVHSKVL